MNRSSFSAIAVLAGSLACGDGGNGPSPAKFEGTWDATKLEFTNTANPAQKIDIIALGATFVVVLQSSGDYQETMVLPGQAPLVSDGTWSVSSDIFTIKESGSSGDMQFDWSLSGNTLTLTGATTDFDFNNDGIDDPAKVSGIFVKR